MADGPLLVPVEGWRLVPGESGWPQRGTQGLQAISVRCRLPVDRREEAFGYYAARDRVFRVFGQFCLIDRLLGK